ncbi:hypothetical protein BHE74_00003653 [Ensete ventricosum]|nr:hypothetical protein BHE74_00003653 [Ensete ventricosum]
MKRDRTVDCPHSSCLTVAVADSRSAQSAHEPIRRRYSVVACLFQIRFLPGSSSDSVVPVVPLNRRSYFFSPLVL